MDKTTPREAPHTVTRRDFIKTSAFAAASVTAMGFPSVVLGQAKKPINACVIGVGGRGRGAGQNFLEAAKIAGVEGKIVALADAFPGPMGYGDDASVNVPANRRFVGLDAFDKAIHTPGVNYVILATPPGFRPPYFRAAVEAGKNVFMEKPVAVDGPGCRIMYATAEVAKQKNLKVAAGTQRRHQKSYIETIQRIHDGAIGDVVAMRVYWVNGGPIWHRGMQGATDLEKQVNNWYHYIWLSGDHITEQHVHNLDVGNWVMKGHPVRCWGMGARQQLGDKPGEIWDEFSVEYEYPNGVRMSSYCSQIQRDWSSVSEAVAGSKGTSNPGGSINPTTGDAWNFKGDQRDAYVQEHVDLINAIQNDTELNEAQQVTDSTLTALMGREAAYSGMGVDWDTMLNSKFEYGPSLLYSNPVQLKWGPFRTLKPPMPSEHNIFATPPVAPVG